MLAYKTFGGLGLLCLCLLGVFHLFWWENGWLSVRLLWESRSLCCLLTPLPHSSHTLNTFTHTHTHHHQQQQNQQVVLYTVDGAFLLPVIAASSTLTLLTLFSHLHFSHLHFSHFHSLLSHSHHTHQNNNTYGRLCCTQWMEPLCCLLIEAACQGVMCSPQSTLVQALTSTQHLHCNTGVGTPCVGVGAGVGW